jgi:hypothetical protein
MRFEIQFELRFSLPQLRFHARGGLPQQSFSVDALLQESRKRRSDTHKDQAPQHCDDEALDVWGYYLASGPDRVKKILGSVRKVNTHSYHFLDPYRGDARPQLRDAVRPPVSDSRVRKSEAHNPGQRQRSSGASDVTNIDNTDFGIACCGKEFAGGRDG